MQTSLLVLFLDSWFLVYFNSFNFLCVYMSVFSPNFIGWLISLGLKLIFSNFFIIK